MFNSESNKDKELSTQKHDLSDTKSPEDEGECRNKRALGLGSIGSLAANAIATIGMHLG